LLSCLVHNLLICNILIIIFKFFFALIQTPKEFFQKINYFDFLNVFIVYFIYRARYSLVSCHWVWAVKVKSNFVHFVCEIWFYKLLLNCIVSKLIVIISCKWLMNLGLQINKYSFFLISPSFIFLNLLKSLTKIILKSFFLFFYRFSLKILFMRKNSVIKFSSHFVFKILICFWVHINRFSKFFILFFDVWF
jgi:hypothetical protein